MALITASPQSVFVFSGAGQRNALYVDLLDLSSLSNLMSQVQINPGLAIYYAAVTLSFTPPESNGVAMSPEEYMNGQFGGRFRWIPAYAGGHSSRTRLSWLDGQSRPI